jgi:CheY-like chemotaxis protein
VLEHIFEPFFTTKGDMGTGLGLATVYGIAKQNGGFVNVYSETDLGTSFKVYFPRIEGAASTDVLKKCFTLPMCTGTVLLVEDNDMVRQVTNSYLEQLGYKVIPVSTPHAGIETCKNEALQIDVILTDVIMPGMSGKEMVDCINTIRPGVKVLFMSGYTSDLLAKRGVVEEGMHLIQKPFDMNSLYCKLQETISSAS